MKKSYRDMQNAGHYMRTFMHVVDVENAEIEGNMTLIAATLLK